MHSSYAQEVNTYYTFYVTAVYTRIYFPNRDAGSRRVLQPAAGVPVAERGERELRARHDAQPVRPHQLPVPELHLHQAGR